MAFPDHMQEVTIIHIKYKFTHNDAIGKKREGSHALIFYSFVKYSTVVLLCFFMRRKCEWQIYATLLPSSSNPRLSSLHTRTMHYPKTQKHPFIYSVLRAVPSKASVLLRTRKHTLRESTYSSKDWYNSHSLRCFRIQSLFLLQKQALKELVQNKKHISSY